MGGHFVLRTVWCSDMMVNMKRHPNFKLIALIRRHKLSKKQVADLCQCGRTSVYSWTRDIDHRDFFKMSGTHMRLLQLELGEGDIPFYLQNMPA